ncbi:MAG TPA: hypothetical protein VGQ57_02990, partial [Polyangiaceae bacterium]|nr:hypothetical protein [Polyangiaceae bacterium]
LAVLKRPRGLGVYNVGTGTAYSVNDLVDLLRDKLKRPIRIETDQARLRPVDRPVLLADAGKLRKDTDWAPRMSMSESLDELIGYYGLK